MGQPNTAEDAQPAGGMGATPPASAGTGGAAGTAARDSALPDDYTGIGLTADTGGHVREASGTVHGQGPFTAPTEYGAPHDGHSDHALPAPSAEQLHWLEQQRNYLFEALHELSTSNDPAQIVPAAVNMITVANGVVYHDGWGPEGLEGEVHEWHRLTGQEGPAEAFLEARDALVHVGETLIGVIGQLEQHPIDAVSLYSELAVQGAQVLVHLAQTSHWARNHPCHTTPQALHVLDEAITQLHQATTQEDITVGVRSVLTMTNAAMYGDQRWADALADEYREWASITGGHGDQHRLEQARDTVVTQATAVRQHLDSWQHHSIDESSATQVAHPLVEALQQARRELQEHHH